MPELESKKIIVRVKPSSKKGPLVQTALDGSLLIFVREPAIEGRANEAVIKLLADHVGVSKSKVQLVGGHKSKTKHFEITSAEE